MRTLRRPLVAWLGILVLLLAACGTAATPTPGPAAAEPIRIGIMAVLTGPFAINGRAIIKTMEWQLRRDGGEIAGRRVEFLPTDSEGKVDVFMSKAKRLMELDKVDFIVGPIHSGIAASARDWMAKQPTVWVIWEVGTVKFYPGDNAVRSVATSWHARPGIGKYFADNYGVKKAITIGLDYAAGHDFVNAEVQKVLPGGNIQVIQQVWVPIGTADFAPYFTKMKLDEADMITGALWGSDAVRFMQQATEFGVKDKVKVLAFPASFALDDMGLPDLGKAAEGFFNWNEIPPPDYPSPAMEKFVDAFKAEFGLLPGYSYKGYITYLQIKQAIESLNGDVSDKAALIKALRQPLETPTETIKFDECGNAIRTLYLKQIKLVGGKAQTSFVAEFPGASLPCPQPEEWK